MAQLQGSVERITYSNKENGFTVAKLRLTGQRGLVKLVGKMASVQRGEDLIVRGQWDRHPVFGRQFNVKSYKSSQPDTLEGIQKYLGSGLIKGIGPHFAALIVARFGLATLAVIDNEIFKLRRVAGIGPQRLDMIRRAWQQHKEMRELLVFLTKYDVSNSVAIKIFNHYGRDSLNVVKHNPYRLAEVRGIGFATADKIALKMGRTRNSPERCRAGIIYTLQRFAEDGHTYCPYPTLIDSCARLLDVKREVVVEVMDDLTGENEVVIEEIERKEQ
jgi:exodeoxyribonuclease V alpha subunit